MISKFEAGFLVAVVLLASAFVFILVHELTHLALADEAWGMCIGYCPLSNGRVALATASGLHNDLSRNEPLAYLTGGIASIGFLWYGFRCLDRLSAD